MKHRAIRGVGWAALILLPAIPSGAAQGAEPTADQIEFFEKQIRPLLAAKCYQCHSTGAETVFAGLRLDSRNAVLKGGDTGPAVVVGNPEASPLIQRLHGKPVLMPPTGRLADAEIDALTRWVEIGAPWAAEQSEPQASPQAAFNLEERKRNHWAWHPVQPVEPPAVSNSEWPRQPIDNFILAELEKNGLEPAPRADRNALIRRLSFDLRGLPPAPGEVKAFVEDQSSDAYEKLVDRYLDSPQFGERWARHWMDLFRYSESHGSEGDPSIPQAWRYRDYLIRALNRDVPYDQLIREHLAGDLLPEPRINAEDQINESVLGTAHYRMVEHAYQPVDAWEDRVKCIDNQIDVVSKAFQGLTVSCARCHDHKFDAISQKDFYSLFGTFYGARPTQRSIDAPSLLNTGREALAQLKQQVRETLSEIWLEKAAGFGALLRNTAGDPPPLETPKALREALDQAACEYGTPLEAWVKLRNKQGEPFRAAWDELSAFWSGEIERREAFHREHFNTLWNLAGRDYQSWVGHGTGYSPEPSKPGEFQILHDGERIINGIYPGGAYTHLLSTRHNGVMQSPRFTIDSDYISLRMLGGDLSFAQLIIENYAVPGGGIYSLRSSPYEDQMDWAQWKTEYWKGFTAYVEFATRDDVTRFYYPEGYRKKRPERRDDGRSYIGAASVVAHDEKLTPQETVVPVLYLLRAQAPDSPGALANLLSTRLREAVTAWRHGDLDEEQAAFLDYFVRRDLLPRSLEQLKPLRSLVAEYRALEETVPAARRAPSVLQERSPDQPLLVRGNHKDPGEVVPRRFLTALGGARYEDPETVRLRLARDIASADNPLTARVMVNRIWRHLFGDGIVRTVDNFGKLGETPTHPELLDYLAARFVEQDWSIKKIVRLLATSQTYRMSSKASAQAKGRDPANKLLQHANVRRLDAEAIRDSLLAVSGRLDSTMYGDSIDVYHTFSEKTIEGGKSKGPLDGEGRRSIYQEIRRNKHNPLLEVFDMPSPMTTRGERDVTNVPAQSLAMLNSPFVIGQAAEWGKRLAAGEALSIDARIDDMFVRALGRAPSGAEREQAADYIARLAKEHQVPEKDILASAQTWQDFAHALFNLKEFIYVF